MKMMIFVLFICIDILSEAMASICGEGWDWCDSLEVEFSPHLRHNFLNTHIDLYNQEQGLAEAIKNDFVNIFCVKFSIVSVIRDAVETDTFSLLNSDGYNLSFISGHTNSESEPIDGEANNKRLTKEPIRIHLLSSRHLLSCPKTYSYHTSEVLDFEIEDDEKNKHFVFVRNNLSMPKVSRLLRNRFSELEDLELIIPYKEQAKLEKLKLLPTGVSSIKFRDLSKKVDERIEDEKNFVCKFFGREDPLHLPLDCSMFSENEFFKKLKSVIETKDFARYGKILELRYKVNRIIRNTCSESLLFYMIDDFLNELGIDENNLQKREAKTAFRRLANNIIIKGKQRTSSLGFTNCHLVAHFHSSMDPCQACGPTIYRETIINECSLKRFSNYLKDQIGLTDLHLLTLVTSSKIYEARMTGRLHTNKTVSSSNRVCFSRLHKVNKDAQVSIDTNAPRQFYTNASCDTDVNAINDGLSIERPKFEVNLTAIPAEAYSYPGFVLTRTKKFSVFSRR